MKAKAKGTSARRRASQSADDGEEAEGGDGSAAAEDQKKKTRKMDPKVSERLQKLEIEKTLVLSKEKWVEKIKAMNKEVTQSLHNAKAFPQTEGFLDFCSLA